MSQFLDMMAMVLCFQLAALDALWEMRQEEKYAHLLSKSFSIFKNNVLAKEIFYPLKIFNRI